MTLPVGRYADLGPPIPEEIPGADGAPLRIIQIIEIAARNGAGEAVFQVDAWGKEGRDNIVMRFIVAANPHTGEIRRVAINLNAGAGFVACNPLLLPGNLRDIIATIATDPRPTLD